MIAMAHRHGALALVGGAQSVSHMPTDVRALDADFFAFSGHKMFAPTGIGVVYGKQAVLDATPPWQGGGNMIADVIFERTTYQPAPGRFEAGAGNIADAGGLGAAIDYLDRIGLAAIERYEQNLIAATVAGLAAIPGLRPIGAPRERAGVVSFVLDGCRAEDVGEALDGEGVAVRAGYHCAQPILRRFGVEATVRPSFALYNGHNDVEALMPRRVASRCNLMAARARDGGARRPPFLSKGVRAAAHPPSRRNGQTSRLTSTATPIRASRADQRQKRGDLLAGPVRPDRYLAEGLAARPLGCGLLACASVIRPPNAKNLQYNRRGKCGLEFLAGRPPWTAESSSHLDPLRPSPPTAGRARRTPVTRRLARAA